MKKYMIILLLSFQGIFAQDFQSYAVNEKNGNENNLTVSFTWLGQERQFVTPQFKGFEQKPLETHFVKSVTKNNKAIDRTTYQYTFKNVKSGNYYFPRASATFGDSIHHTKPIAITIVGPITTEEIKALRSKAKKGMRIITEVSLKHPKVKDSIVVTYAIAYTNLSEVTDIGTSKTPDFHDFKSDDLGVFSYDPVRVEDKGYSYFIFKRMLAIPKKSGVLKIDSLQAKVNVNFLAKQADNSEDVMIGGQSVILEDIIVSSEPITINVKP